MLRKLAVLFWTTALLSCACFAQYSKTSIIIVATAPAGSCTNGSSPRLVISSGNIYTCQSQTWAAVTGAGSMTWPGAAGIPNYNGASAWGTSYSATNSIPANFLPAALSSSTSINGISVPGNIVFNNQANTYSGGGLQDLSAMKLKPPTSTVAGLPTASSNTNVVYEVTDGASATDCTTGGGSTRVWCSSNGVSWVALAGSGGGGSVSVNGSSVSNPNFNDTTPVAGVNGINVSWQQSSGNVSAEIVGDGNVAHCLIGTGLFSACPSGGANTALSNLVSPALNAAPSPGTDASISLDDLTHRYVNAWLSGVLGWTNGAGTADTGFSRDSAGVVDVGNGTAGDASGTVKAAAVQTTGSNGGWSAPNTSTGSNCNGTTGNNCLYSDTTGFHEKSNGSDLGVVTTASNTQTLTGKTMSGASNTFSNIGNGSLSNSAIMIAGTSVSLGGTTSSFPSPGAIGGTTPSAGSFTTLTATTFNTTTKCAATGSAANPSAVACSAAPAGFFSCATNASTGTCVVSTTAVTANSVIQIEPDSTLGTALSVTCNTSMDTGLTAPRVSARTAGTSFTISLGTFSTNPECFSYIIVN